MEINEINQLKENEISRLAKDSTNKEIESMLTGLPYFQIRFPVKIQGQEDLTLLVAGTDTENFQCVFQHWNSYFREWRTLWEDGYPELAERMAQVVSFKI